MRRRSTDRKRACYFLFLILLFEFLLHFESVGDVKDVKKETSSDRDQISLGKDED